MYYFETSNRLESYVQRPETHPLGNILKLVWRQNPGEFKGQFRLHQMMRAGRKNDVNLIEKCRSSYSCKLVNWSLATSMKRDVMGFPRNLALSISCPCHRFHHRLPAIRCYPQSSPAKKVFLAFTDCHKRQ